jgi:hypothetical protein
MSMLTIHFNGMCCFLDGREADSFTKRVVLPRDMHFAEYKDDPHVPYLEIDADDLQRGATVRPSKTYARGDGATARSFHRFTLDGERVWIRNVAHGNGHLVVVPTFDERIPQMTLVCPDCPPNPRTECFLPNPPDDLIAAYFDIRSGYLNAGLLELGETAFDEGSQWPTRRLAKWACLDLAVHGDRAEIVIEKFDGTGARVIPLRRGAGVVTIGNGREQDIEETSTGSNRREHFEMYYDLGAELPAKRPRPTTPKSAIRGCAPAQWP